MTDPFTVRVLRGDSHEVFRWSIVVPTARVPKATARNRIRRQISEALRRIQKAHPTASGKRLIVTVRGTAASPRAVLEEELLSVLRKSGILTP